MLERLKDFNDFILHKYQSSRMILERDETSFVALEWGDDLGNNTDDLYMVKCIISGDRKVLRIFKNPKCDDADKLAKEIKDFLNATEYQN